MRGLVFSGGGSKGAYEVGVWKALRKLHIKIDIVTGTSIGAINAIMFTQKQFYKCLNLWENIDYTQLFEDDFSNLTTKTEVYLNYAKAFLKGGGMNTSKIEKLIEGAIDSKKFYKSRIKYGLVTYNVTNREPLLLEKSQIPKEKLKQYVLASATCFPAFKVKTIDDKKFVDGGYYDNLPINFAIDLGATNIIAVNLNEIGLIKEVKDKSIPIKYIEPKNDLGSFLVFDKELAKKNIKYGYNDTMKAYDKLDGNTFTFKRNHLYRNYLKYKWKFNNLIKEIFENTIENKNIYDNFIKYSKFKKIIDKTLDDMIVFNETVEFLGKTYELDDTKIYRINDFNKELIINNRDYNVSDTSLISLRTDDFQGIVNTKLLIKYIFNKLDSEQYDWEIRKELCKLASMFPNEFLGAIYLLLINGKY